ncbi:MAG: carbonic anhydrase [Gammaproteobacteria bacterium]|nr:carbonic anhydrase [Gammaproteobacteria bacterium]
MGFISNKKRSIFLLPTFFLALGVMPIATLASKIEWSYEGETSPEYWANLSPEFHLCSKGTQQSPIDITVAKSSDDLPELKFKYKKTPLIIKNNGHAIEVEYEQGSTLKLDGEKYRLLQFHFHTPSEHAKDGSAYPMEAHLVHINTSGQLAVVGIFMKQGKENKFIQKIWDYMPEEEGKIMVEDTRINIKKFLPDDNDEGEEYYHYAGSLTTPPCSEGVKWFVLNEAVEISAEQITQFQAIFPLNARPVQALNDRMIYERDD